MEVFILKNLFLVINKEKIYAYIVSVLTIVTLFSLSSMINNDLNDAEVLSSNVLENSISENIIDNTENNILENNM